MNFYKVSNLDIKMLYIENEYSESSAWKVALFEKTKFFAEKRARRIKRSDLYDDIMQEALCGLWIAIETFDYNKNFDFYRWAQWNISSKIRNFCKDFIINGDSSGVSYNKDDSFDLEKNLDYCFIISEINNSKKLNSNEKSAVLKSIVLEQTLVDIGKDLSLSPERVRQLKNQGMEKIRKIYFGVI